MSNTYLVSSNHLENTVWFRDEDDFKAGMNAVAVVHAGTKTDILAFILMSNHVHFVLKCRKDEAKCFIDKFKQHYSRYISIKYGIRELLRRNEVDIRILEEEESVEKAIAYVLMNCVAANICLHPVNYPWGTGRCYFSEIPITGIPVSSLKKRAFHRLVHSKVLLPGSYIIGHEGYILPESYVEIKRVESLFRTPRRMNYFLNMSSKSKQKLEKETTFPAFRDQYIIAGMGDICKSLFRKDSMAELNRKEQIELLRQLRFRFSCNIHQLARVSGFSYEDVVIMLDSD